jgi:ParB-like chromosome segregation protein Spo0J
MARASSKAVSDDHLEELESIGKKLQKRKVTPAKKPSKSVKKKVSEQQLQEAYIKYLAKSKGHKSITEVVETLGSSRGVVSRAFLRFKKDSKLHVIEAITVKEERVIEEPEPITETPTLDPKRERIMYLTPGELDNTRYQPRTGANFTPDLKADILRSGGNVQPVILQDRGDNQKPATVDGHRRVRAIDAINMDRKPADLMMVQCIVLPMSDQEAALKALRANTLHEPLTQTDRDAWAYKLVSTFRMSRAQVMKELGLSETALSNIIRAHEKTIKPIREMLETRQISLGSAKIIAGLHDDDQKKIHRSLKKSTGLSVHQVEDKAKEFRNRREARNMLQKFFEGLGSKEYKMKDDYTLFNKVFGGWRHKGYLPRKADVEAAAKAAGVSIIRPEVSEKLKELQDEAKAKGEVPPTKVNICNGCQSYFTEKKLCIQPGKKPPAEKCELYLNGRVSYYKYSVCPICEGPTLFEMKGVSYGRFDHSEDYKAFGLKGRSHSTIPHGKCMISQLVKTKRLSGPCSECQNGKCTVVRALKRRQGLKVKVVDCDSEFMEHVDIEKVNQWAIETYVKEANASHARAKKGGKA